ncbi:MAG: hypothetical protein ACI9GK_003074, partial [Devosia sp.]
MPSYYALPGRKTSMSLIQVELDRNVHPVDIIEHIASI